jgi:hypothetical protein
VGSGDEELVSVSRQAFRERRKAVQNAPQCPMGDVTGE